MTNSVTSDSTRVERAACGMGGACPGRAGNHDAGPREGSCENQTPIGLVDGVCRWPEKKRKNSAPTAADEEMATTLSVIE